MKRLIPLVNEYFRAYTKPSTYNPRVNLYALFGFAWGLPVPLITLLLSIYLLGLAPSFASVATIFDRYPFQYFFLVHPLLFYLVFGALGTINREREEQIRAESQALKEMQDQLIVRERMAMIGSLAAGVAHEINNPVGILLAKTGFLKTLDPESPAARSQIIKDLDKYEAHLLRIAGITRSLLSFARQSVATTAPVDLPALIRETLVFMEHSFMKNKITVTCDLQEQRATFHGSSGELQQILLNLFGNALDAMQSDGSGSLRISFVESDTRFIIRIADSGPGVPPDIRSRIMEPFFTTKAIGKGTGLGLSISYGIVEKHGGSLTLDPACSGGAVFVISLPVKASSSTHGHA